MGLIEEVTEDVLPANNIEGVSNVAVKGTISVEITCDFDRDTRERVFAFEMDLFEKYPDVDFDFNVLPTKKG